MKHYTFLQLTSLVVILLFLLPVYSKAQSASVIKSNTNKNQSSARIYPVHKKMPSAYTGFFIELVRSERPLYPNHSIFQQFGNIRYQRIYGVGYSYGIIADFSTYKSVKRYCEQIVKPQIDTATIFEYKYGKRKKK